MNYPIITNDLLKIIMIEQTHNIYIVEDVENNDTHIDGKHNIECLDKMLESVDKALENLKQ